MCSKGRKNLPGISNNLKQGLYQAWRGEIRVGTKGGSNVGVRKGLELTLFFNYQSKAF